MTKSTVPAIVRLQAVDRKARDGPDAGFAGGQLGPVVGLAGAKRGHDAHAGDDDDRPAEFVAWCCHDVPRRCLRRAYLTASTRAMPSPCQWPAPTTTIWVGGSAFQPRTRSDRWAETARRARSTAPPAQGRAGIGFPACGRTSCRSRAPQSRDAARRNAFSSDVAGSAPVAPVMIGALVSRHAELAPQRFQRLRHRARLLALREVGDHAWSACA